MTGAERAGATVLQPIFNPLLLVPDVAAPGSLSVIVNIHSRRAL